MENFWCGDEAGFELVMSAEVKANDMKAQGKTLEGFKLPPLYERQGSVGVVPVKGPLVAGEAGFMRLFGVTGYNDIRAGLLEAINDKNVKSILLDINSPGGSVNGTSDTAKFIQSISAIKPVTAFADNAASAGYWLASAASHITAAETAIVGSIGVLRIHTEYSAALEKEGIKKTILRKGKYKALANPIEPLNADAIAEIDGQLEDLYKSFVTTVASNRDTTYEIADAKMAQGREFLGKRGLEAGLIDKIGSYEEALAFASNNVSVNRGASATTSLARASVLDNNTGMQSQGIEVKPTLDEDQVALAAVVPGEEGDATLVALTEIDGVKAELATALTLVTTKDTELASLNTQLVEAQASIEAGKQAAIDAGEALNAVSAVVSAYTSNMMVALGSKPDVLAGMNTADLLAKHKEISQLYKTKFRAGGTVAAGSVTTEKKAAVVDPLFSYRVQSAVAN
jgi:signal peptide peptidase SppA